MTKEGAVGPARSRRKVSANWAAWVGFDSWTNRKPRASSVSTARAGTTSDNGRVPSERLAGLAGASPSAIPCDESDLSG
jgi:hypothetical protein